MDRFATMTSGPRSGQRCEEQLLTRVRDHQYGLELPHLMVDYALCNPFRTSFLCGKTRLQHGVENQVSDYYLYWRLGVQNNRVSDAAQQWTGPWMVDVAMQYAKKNAESYDQSYLPASHWPIVGHTGTMSSRTGTSEGPGHAVGAIGRGSGPVQTTVAAGSNGVLANSFTGSGTLNVASTTNFTTPTAQTPVAFAYVGSGPPYTVISYTGKTSTTLTGCTLYNGRNVTLTTGMTVTSDFGDHLQAFTGSLLQWLSYEGIAVGVIGKIGNEYGSPYTSPFNDNAFTGGSGALTDQYVPPGPIYWACVTGDTMGDGDIQDHWHMTLCEWKGTSPTDNPADGVGVIGTQYKYRYNHLIESISYASSELTITLTAGDQLYDNEYALVKAGQEIAVTDCTGAQAGYNNPVWVISSVVDKRTFKVRQDFYGNSVTNLGTWTGADAVAYPRALFSEQVLKAKVLEFWSLRSDTEDAFCYWPSRMPHAEVNNNDTTGVKAYSFEEEQRYIGTVPATQAHYFGGVAGAVNPAVDIADIPLSGGGGNGQTDIWLRRQEMLASLDDCRGEVLTYQEGRWGVDFEWWDLSDNGWQDTAQGATDTGVGARVGAKGFIYRGSLDLPFFLRSPRLPAFGKNNVIVMAQDLAPSVIDRFKRRKPNLKTHHIFTTGDGVSLDRKIAAQANPADPLNSMGYVVIGDWHNVGNCFGLVEQDLFKYVENKSTPSDNALWDLNTKPIVSASWGGGVATFNCPNHGRVTGDRVWIYATPAAWSVAGATQSTYANKTCTVLDSNHFTVPMAVNPGTFTSGWLWDRWETENLASSNPVRAAAMRTRLYDGKSTGRFDPTSGINGSRTF